MPISLNRLSFLIAPNLSSALRSLRYGTNGGGQPRTLWIDAVCIHQENIKKRNQQAARMREIYALSEKVIL
jgi:hypothetical protein